MSTAFRPMRPADVPEVLGIIEQAKQFLAASGVDQWQDGYPNEAAVWNDIASGQGHVLVTDERVAGIATIIRGIEPSYNVIHQGRWATPEPYAALHRVAVAAAARGTGAAGSLMQAAEASIRADGIFSVRIDTHRDNAAMLAMLQRGGYTRCGVIYLLDSGAERIALEKRLGE